MYSKVTIFGHPVHPMLVAFPVAFYTGALVGFIVFAANGGAFWLDLAIALSIAGAGMAILAALPGFVDLTFGVPHKSRATRLGVTHASFNVVALVLFIITVVAYVGSWNDPTVGAALGVVLTAIAVACTIVAGALGWTLVQTYHVGVRLSPAQQQGEAAVHHLPSVAPVEHRRAS